MHLFHELHIDDDLLEARRDRRTFEAARDLVEAIVGVAEGRGQEMALRFRHHFARAALEHGDGCLAAWEERGHEIGAHAHRRHVRATVEALRAAGVRRLDGVVPGLICCSRGRCRRILKACEGLGLSYVSDQVQFGAFPYAGLVPWRPAADLSGPGDGPWIFVDVSVNPFDWGLLRRQGQGVVQTFGLRDDHFDRLLALLDHQLELPRPGETVYFGYPVHEHNHCASPETLTPDQRSLEAWDRFLARALERPVVSCLPRDLAGGARATEGSRGVLARGLDVLSFAEDHLPRRPPRRVRHRGEARVLRVGPEQPRLEVVVSHAGTRGGTRERLGPWGLRTELFEDVAFWFFDREGDLSPGNPRHAEQLVEVFRQTTARAGLLSWSAGLIPALVALDRIDPAFLIDTEGPSDRLSLVPASDEADEAGHRTCLGQPRSWEPFRLLPSLEAPYHRLQGRRDHMHGCCTLHAEVLVSVAVDPHLHLVEDLGSTLAELLREI